MNKPNFFDACVVPTSLFNIDYAKSGEDPGWQDLEECYNTNYLEDFSPVENPIPKKIHFIWLGGPLPKISTEIYKIGRTRIQTLKSSYGMMNR